MTNTGLMTKQEKIAHALDQARKHVALAAALDPTNEEIDMVWRALFDMTSEERD